MSTIDGGRNEQLRREGQVNFLNYPIAIMTDCEKN
jgi:hypothetical protein